ncbi:MAG: hypothetical protein K2G55_21665, partial [Lachnospiraceae bacterium]|nr:hypothetical protein [Lachnospiraceae bacterium]
GRGISVGWCCISAIYGSSTYMMRYIGQCGTAPVIVGKGVYREYIGKMVSLLANLVIVSTEQV